MLPTVGSAADQAWGSVAIVGRPNVGKSSILNRLLDEDRSIVDSVPGTTRDPIDSFLPLDEERRLRIVDTAGMRREVQIKDPIEYFSFLRSRGTLRGRRCRAPGGGRRRRGHGPRPADRERDRRSGASRGARIEQVGPDPGDRSDRPRTLGARHPGQSPFPPLGHGDPDIGQVGSWRGQTRPGAGGRDPVAPSPSADRAGQPDRQGSATGPTAPTVGRAGRSGSCMRCRRGPLRRRSSSSRTVDSRPRTCDISRTS